jgi:hypothetical protein
VSSSRKAHRADFRSGLGENPPARSRARWFAAVIVSVAALAGTAAALGIGPFGGLFALATTAIHPGAVASQIEAESLFPPVRPRHKVIDVYDAGQPAPLSPPGGRSGPAGGAFPVINFPAGPMSAIESACEAAKQAGSNKGEAYQQNVELQCEAAKQAYERAHP